MATETVTDIEKDVLGIRIHETREAFEAHLVEGYPADTRIDREELGAGLAIFARRPAPFNRPIRWPVKMNVLRRDSKRLPFERRMAAAQIEGDDGGEVREILVRVVSYSRWAPDGRGVGMGMGAFPLEPPAV